MAALRQHSRMDRIGGGSAERAGRHGTVGRRRGGGGRFRRRAYLRGIDSLERFEILAYGLEIELCVTKRDGLHGPAVMGLAGQASLNARAEEVLDAANDEGTYGRRHRPERLRRRPTSGGLVIGMVMHEVAGMPQPVLLDPVHTMSAPRL